MIKKFRTLFFVKSSLISLYLALTIPLPFISIEELKIISIAVFIFGFFLIINITSDYVETSKDKISYKTTLVSNLIGKKNWEVYWKDVKTIKSSPTSQGSKVYYFITHKNQKVLVPQRIENLKEFWSVIVQETGIDSEVLNYISPIWTYKLLTFLSVIMVIGEVVSFSF